MSSVTLVEKEFTARINRPSNFTVWYHDCAVRVDYSHFVIDILRNGRPYLFRVEAISQPLEINTHKAIKVFQERDHHVYADPSVDVMTMELPEKVRFILEKLNA